MTRDDWPCPTLPQHIALRRSIHYTSEVEAEAPPVLAQAQSLLLLPVKQPSGMDANGPTFIELRPHSLHAFPVQQILRGQTYW